MSDGAALEKTFKKLIDLAKNEPDVPDVKFNADKHGQGYAELAGRIARTVTDWERQPRSYHAARAELLTRLDAP